VTDRPELEPSGGLAGERLSVYLEETDRHGSTPLWVEIVERARREGMAGATVCEGVQGYGASAGTHRAGRFAVVHDVPVVVTIVDVPENIDRFVESLRRLEREAHIDLGGLIVRSPVRILGPAGERLARQAAGRDQQDHDPPDAVRR
jgi:PII-like signaling protein